MAIACRTTATRCNPISNFSLPHETCRITKKTIPVKFSSLLWLVLVLALLPAC